MGSGSGQASPARSGGRATSLEAERRRVAALLEEEARSRAEGFRVVAGVDEVGRGCLAGPVYAGAVVLGYRTPLGIDDSKALPACVREDLTPRIEKTAKGCAV